MANQEAAVAAIATHNQAHCNIPQVLDALDITVSTVPALYLYLFELVQNALDIGATQLRFVLSDDSMQVEHNGADFGTTDVHVRGLANVFQSTKSIGSIGFMGFGFKTIYKRFRRVGVSDTRGWRFAFDVAESEITLAPGVSVYARHWLGAMVPVWDASLPAPTEGYSTLFRLTGVTSDTQQHPLIADLREAFFEDDGAALAILATKARTRHGLTRLDFALPDGLVALTLQQTAQASAAGVTVVMHGHSSSLGIGGSGEEGDCMDVDGERTLTREWLVLHHAYVPPDKAIRSLCQARLKNLLVHYGKGDIQSVWARMKREHALIGLVELQGGLLVAPRSLFATLPLAAQTPFGLHIQADWLLDLARQGVRDVQTNDWQRSIVEQVPALVAHYLRHVATFTERVSVAAAFRLLAITDASKAAATIDFPLSAWAAELHNFAVWPVLSGGPLHFATSADVIVLPAAHAPLASLVCPQALHLLFGKFVLDRELVGDALADDLVTVGVLTAPNLDELLAQWTRQGLRSWWAVAGAPLPPTEQPTVLFSLWNFLLAVLPPTLCVKLPCVLTARNTWIAPTQVEVLECKRLFKMYEAPSRLVDGELGEFPARLLAAHLPECLLPPGWVDALLAASRDFTSPMRAAYEWISSLWRKCDFVAAVQAAMDSETPAAADLLDYTPHTPREHSTRIVVAVQEALLSAPYVTVPVASARDAAFASLPRISGDYATLPVRLTLFQWRQVFEELGACGAAQLETVQVQSVPVLPDYRKAKEKVAELLNVPVDTLVGVNTTRTHGWKLWDVKFTVEPPPTSAPTLLQWLEDNVGVFEEARGAIYAEGYDRRPYYATAKPGSAAWVRTLRTLPWVPLPSPEGLPHFVTPEHASLVAAQAALSPRLLSALLARGLCFA